MYPKTSFEIECPTCGKKFMMPNNEEPMPRIMAGVDRNIYKNGKPYFYCWPCYQKLMKEFKQANPDFRCH